jgi:FkbM family methyltransferase
MLIKRAPKGHHLAIEPLSECVQRLRQRFGEATNLTILPFALSNTSGQQLFNAISEFPGYSSFAKRAFRGAEATVEQRSVETRCLDELVPEKGRIDFIKLDIEGAELKALQGAEKLLAKARPTLLLEFQRTAAPYFECSPNEMFDFLTRAGYKIWSLEQWLTGQPPLKLNKLWDLFEGDPNLYLLCRPKEMP